MRLFNPKCNFPRLAILSLGFGASRVGADNVYVQNNLVSDLPGIAARQDMNMINDWGIDHSPTGPWWVNAAGTGLSLVLDGNGAHFGSVSDVTIPPAAGNLSPSSPTGIAFNGTTDFQLAPGKQAFYLFATEDGTISGWNPMVNPTNAILKVTSPGAIFKGIAIGRMNGRNVAYAANFSKGTVDVFDGGFVPVPLNSGAFQDSLLPPGFAPFNVQSVDGSIFVMYAMQDEDKEDEIAGPGLGYVDKFTPEGVLVVRLDHGSWLNAPWAVVHAPGNFGKLSQHLLVGQFGSGQIAAFNAQTGKFQGMMEAPDGKPVTIEGLWGLNFGNGAGAGPQNLLYFAAGIDDEKHGLFGTLSPQK